MHPSQLEHEAGRLNRTNKQWIWPKKKEIHRKANNEQACRGVKLLEASSIEQKSMSPERKSYLEGVYGTSVRRDNILGVGEQQGGDSAGFEPTGEQVRADFARFSALNLLPHPSSIFVQSLSLSLCPPF